MYCWGDNWCGQLGLVKEEREEVHFKKNTFFQKKAGVQKVVCGGKHSLFLLEDGTVFSCGHNHSGQLGRKSTSCSIVQIYALEAQTIVDVSSGENHSMAVCSQGNAFGWGAGSEGQLGAGEFTEKTVTPKRITGLSNNKIIQISCGHFHSIALSEDGSVYSWGQNSTGQLGLGKQIPNQASPQLVKSLKGIPLAQVTAGGSQSFALSLSGSVFAWGKNNAGQLGFQIDSKKAGMFKPYAVSSLRNLGVVYISCGDEHTAVLTKNGSVYTFGDDTYGQLGQSSRNQTSVPQKMDTFEGQASQVDCGSYHTLVYVFTCSRILSFGRGSQRQLDNAASPDQAQLQQQPWTFDISTLFSSEDSLDIHVKWIFAGNHVSFATSSRQSQHSERTLTDSLPKISRLDKTIIKKWMKAYTGSDEFQKAKREISTIFSSAACLTASFIKHSPSMPLQVTSPTVDLEVASNLFAELNKDNRFYAVVCSSLTKGLIPELQSLPLLREPLSIFLVLPECSLMHDPDKCLSLVIPFANAVNNLSENALKIMATLWSSLQASSLFKQIQMLKKAVLLSVLCGDVIGQSSIKNLLEMLKKLYKVNMKANCIIPTNAFYIDELYSLLITPADINNWRLWQTTPEADENAFPAIYCRFPFIFNFATKIAVLHCDSLLKKKGAQLKAQQEIALNRMHGSSELPKSPVFHLKVRRSHLVEDTLHKLNIVEDCDLKKEMLVEFQEEGAFVMDGLMGELFLYVFEEMVHPDFGMFPISDPLLPIWFPSHPLVKKKTYFHFGVLCGLAIFNQKIVYLPFPLALFKKLLGKKTTLDDLKELQPTMGKSMQEVLEYQKEDVENLEVYFCFSWQKKTVDLIPNGALVPVNNSNKHDYVNKCIDYIFNTSVAETFEEFKRGLYKVCDKEILSFFQPQELMNLVVGYENYDWNNFEKIAVYLGTYHRYHPTINMFWKVFHALSLQQKKDFLLFLTGNNRIPVFGVDNLKMKISSYGFPSELYLPEAQTCFNILFLPEYSNIELLREKLLLAIKNNKGFGKVQDLTETY